MAAKIKRRWPLATLIFGGVMKKRSERVFGLVLLAAVVACACGWTRTAQAQAIYGSVYGTITDKTGAAIPNATITVTDESKGTSVQVTSNQSGEYTVPNLIPDVYDVKASAAGFSPRGEPWNSGLSRHFAQGRPATQCRQSPPKASLLLPRHPSCKPIARTSGPSSTKDPFPTCLSRGATLPAFNC